MMALLHAMSVCHGRAQRLDNLRMTLSVAIGVAGAVVAFTGVSALGVTAVGALWAVVNAIGLGPGPPARSAARPPSRRCSTYASSSCPGTPWRRASLSARRR